MRILVVNGPGPLDAGTREWLQRLSHSLEVEVWAPQEGSALRRGLATLAGCARAVVRTPRVAARAFVAAERSTDLRTALRCLKLTAKMADVLYFPRPAVALAYLPAMAFRPSVVRVPPGEGVSAPRNFADVLRRATILHYMFDVDRREVEAEGILGIRAVVARAGFDPRAYAMREKAVGRTTLPLRLLVACDFEPRAGVEDALVAVRIATDRGLDVRLDVLGAGPERERVVHAVHDLRLDAIVSVRDPIPPHELVATLREVHAFIHPHLMGALGWEALTAMALGVPVVAVDAGSAADIIQDGRDGFLVSYGDVEAAAGRLLALSSQPELVSSVTDQAHRRVIDLFAPEAQAAALASVFAAVMEQGQTVTP